MNLLRAYNRCLCIIVVLGITSFSTASSAGGSAAALLAAFALPVSVGAWWLSVRHRMLLPRSVVNLLLLAVLAYAALQAAARRFDVDSVAELVIFIQLIKLGDRRAPRDDAQILSLAVFLAIAAMLTNNGFWVGVQLFIFIPLLMGTVMLFQLYSGWSRAAGREPQGPAPADGLPRPVGPTDAGRHLRSTTVFATVATLLMGAVVFIIMPRGVGQDAFGSWPTPRAGSVTRFTENVKLGSRSIISESPRIVLDLTVHEAGGIAEPPGVNLGAKGTVYYLRGAVLDTYQSGAWQPDPGRKLPEASPFAPGAPVPMGSGARSNVLQTVTARSLEANSPLFAMWRPFRATLDREEARVQIDHASRIYRRVGQPGPVQYRVWSAVIEESSREPDARTPASFNSAPIRELTAGVLQDGGISPDPASRPIGDDFRAARLIQDHLQKGFAYSLVEPGIQTGEDPIEHFLFQTRTGHCEYFAAAMVAMCRSVGINARMIAGYVAAEFDDATLRYVVRESNAHAWVEVEGGVGRWRRYDPTPPDDLTRIHRATPGLLGRLRRALDSIEYAWNSSVVGFDQISQRRLLGPGPGEASPGALDLLSRRVRRIGGRAILSSMFLGVLVFAAVAVVGIVGQYLYLTLRGLLGRPGGRSGAASAVVPAQFRFYQQLLDLLRKRGLAKPAWRPPMDHAGAVESADAPLGAAARRLTALYYQARFGGRPLSPADLDAARTLLRDLSKPHRA